MAPLSAEATVDLYNIPPPPGSPYSVPVPGSEKEGRSAVYRHWRIGSGPLITTLDPGVVLTAHDVFESSATKHPSAKCLGARPWNPTTKAHEENFVWQTYSEVAIRRKNFGGGILELHKGLGVSGDRYGVGLWCQNRPEWQITDLGCMSQSLFTVSIYDTLGPDTTEYIINHAELKCIVTSLNHIPTLLKIAPRCPNLKLIVCMDPLENGDKPGESKLAILNAIAADVGIKIHAFTDVEALGEKLALPMNPPRPEDVITINYTSGTTGNPKGVILVHSAAVAAASAGRIIVKGDPTGIMMSYLPLAHIYERACELGAFYGGSAIGYFRGDVLGLVDDLKILKPTGFLSVPRLFNRFGTAIRAATIEADGVRGTLGRHVIETKLATMELGPGKAHNKHFLWDRIFTPRLRGAVGLTKAERMISGSAPLDPSLHKFLRAAFGNEVQQGYGLTESYAVTCCQTVDDWSTGNCGGLGTGTEACLMSVPDMEYLVTDKPHPRGELLLGGPQIFREYLKNPEETKKALIDGGKWFRTGDIAEIDSLGRIKIIDRVKNVLKLAQGEYISPERIENVYLANTGLFTLGYVHGDSTQAFLVAIFGIDPVQFAPFASGVLRKTISAEDIDAVKAAANDLKVRKAVVKELDKIGRKSKFNSYERVRCVHLELEPFTVENELLTPTLKLKRPQAVKKYRAVLDRLYEEALAEENEKPKL